MWGGPLSIQARFIPCCRAETVSGVTGTAWHLPVLRGLIWRNRIMPEPGFDLHQGKGALRTWLEFSQGHLTGVTADVAITEVAVTLGADFAAAGAQSFAGAHQRTPPGQRF